MGSMKHMSQNTPTSFAPNLTHTQCQKKGAKLIHPICEPGHSVEVTARFLMATCEGQETLDRLQLHNLSVGLDHRRTQRRAL